MFFSFLLCWLYTKDDVCACVQATEKKESLDTCKYINSFNCENIAKTLKIQDIFLYTFEIP